MIGLPFIRAHTLSPRPQGKNNSLGGPAWSWVWRNAKFSYLVSDPWKTGVNLVDGVRGAAAGNRDIAFIPYMGKVRLTQSATEELLFTSAACAFTGSMTLAAICYPTLVGVEGILSTSQTNAGLRLQWATGSLGVTHGGVAALDSNIAISTNTPYFVACSVNRTTGRALFVVRDLSTHVVTTADIADANSINAGTTGFVFGAATAGGNPFIGSMAMGHVTQEAFTVDQLTLWARDPWGPFAPQERRVWVPSVAAGGFQAAWASQRSRVIGAGVH